MTTAIEVPWMASALRDAYEVASKSPDPSTQCGALIGQERRTQITLNGEDVFITIFDIQAMACNTFTSGVEATPERLVRPLKYDFVEHAERGAVYDAARKGVRCAGLTMVAPWAACTECARSLVASGISRLVRHKQASDRSPERWIDSIKQADEILDAGGVEIVDYDGSLGGVEIWHCEELWIP